MSGPVPEVAGDLFRTFAGKKDLPAGLESRDRQIDHRNRSALPSETPSQRSGREPGLAGLPPEQGRGTWYRRKGSGWRFLPVPWALRPQNAPCAFQRGISFAEVECRSSAKARSKVGERLHTLTRILREDRNGEHADRTQRTQPQTLSHRDAYVSPRGERKLAGEVVAEHQKRAGGPPPVGWQRC